MAGWPNTCPRPTKVHAGQVLVAKPCAFSLTLTLSQLGHQRKSSPLCSSVSLLVIQSQRQRVQVSPRRLFCHSLPSEGAKMAQHMSHQVKVGLGQKWSEAKGIGTILKMSQTNSKLKAMNNSHQKNKWQTNSRMFKVRCHQHGPGGCAETRLLLGPAFKFFKMAVVMRRLPIIVATTSSWWLHRHKVAEEAMLRGRHHYCTSSRCTMWWH